MVYSQKYITTRWHAALTAILIAVSPVSAMDRDLVKRTSILFDLPGLIFAIIGGSFSGSLASHLEREGYYKTNVALQIGVALGGGAISLCALHYAAMSLHDACKFGNYWVAKRHVDAYKQKCARYAHFPHDHQDRIAVENEINEEHPETGLTPLHAAVNNRQKKTDAIVELLVSCGAKMKVAKDQRFSEISLVCHLLARRYFKAAQIVIDRRLTTAEKPALIYYFYKYCRTNTVEVDKSEQLQLLQDCGADIEYCANFWRHTPLHVAVEDFSRFDTLWDIQWLIKNGACLDKRNAAGKTPLMCAAFPNIKGDGAAIAQCLLIAGADASVVNDRLPQLNNNGSPVIDEDGRQVYAAPHRVADLVNNAVFAETHEIKRLLGLSRTELIAELDMKESEKCGAMLADRARSLRSLDEATKAYCVTRYAREGLLSLLDDLDLRVSRRLITERLKKCGSRDPGLEVERLITAAVFGDVNMIHALKKAKRLGDTVMVQKLARYTLPKKKGMAEALLQQKIDADRNERREYATMRMIEPRREWRK